jgi:hypothetical protein
MTILVIILISIIILKQLDTCSQLMIDLKQVWLLGIFFGHTGHFQCGQFGLCRDKNPRSRQNIPCLTTTVSQETESHLAVAVEDQVEEESPGASVK